MGKKEIKRFLFNCEWKDIIKDLPDKSRLRVYEAIIDYADTGALPKLNPTEKVSFEFMRKEVDWNGDKYEEIRQRRVEAGKRGGMRSGESRRAKQNEANEANEANASNAKQNEAKRSSASMLEANEANNVNVNDNVNDNELSNDNNNLSIVNNATSIAPQIDPQDEQKQNEALKRKKMVDGIVSYYNSAIAKAHARLRTCNTQRMTVQRQGWIGARIDEYGEENVRKVIDKAVASRFLNYEASNAPVGIDWIMRPNNFPKVLEGNYDNKTKDPMYDRIHFEGEYNPHAYDEDKEIAKRQWQE